MRSVLVTLSTAAIVAASVAVASVSLDRVSTAGAAADLDVMVHRHADYVEVFMQMPSTAIEAVFDGDAAAFKDARGLIEFERLTNGTWQEGDALFGALSGAVNGQAIDVEVMSAMFHPAGSPPEFRDPHDAVVGMSVCGVEPPRSHLALDEMVTVVGFFIDGAHGDAPLSFALPRFEDGPLSVNLREFNGYALTSQRLFELDAPTFTTQPGG